MEEKERILEIKIMKRVVKNNSFIILVLLLIFSSCGERETYLRFQELENSDWAIDQTLVFNLDSVNIKPDVPYDISIELTNNVNYPYRNLWLSISLEENDSIVIERDVQFILADEYARWTGAGFGSLFQSSHPLRQKKIFTTTSNLSIYIRHKMQDEKLHGIERVGIKIKEHKESL